MSALERCPSYKESNKGNKQRQGPTLGVRFTEVSVKILDMRASVSVKEDKYISLSVGFRAQNNNRSTDNVRSRLPLVPTKFRFARHFDYPGYQRFFLACDGELRFVGRRTTRVRPKAEDTSCEATHFLRLDRRRKPRMKSLWHPGYILTGYVNNRPEKKFTLLRFERTSIFFHFMFLLAY